MTAYTTWLNSNANHRSNNGVFCISSKEVDLGGTTAADTFDLFVVPDGCVPLSTCVEITEAAGETCTIDIGVTGGDVDAFVNGADINVTAGTFETGDTVTVPASLIAATTVSALAVTGSTYAAGKFKVHMVVASCAVG